MNLPTRHHPGDAMWIAEQLRTISAEIHPKLAEKAAISYSNVYAEVYEKSEPEHRKDGFARQVANERLRLYITNLQSRAKLPPMK